MGDYPTKRLIPESGLPAKGINISPSQRKRMIAEGRFPRPIYLSPRKFAWDEAVLDQWIEQLGTAA